MTAREYEARYRDEVKWLRRYYCTLFAFWKSCRFKRCRKGRVCAGNALECLKRHEAFVSREKQFAARQDVLAATPKNIGAPERLARQAMPAGLWGDREYTVSPRGLTGNHGGANVIASRRRGG